LFAGTAIPHSPEANGAATGALIIGLNVPATSGYLIPLLVQGRDRFTTGQAEFTAAAQLSTIGTAYRGCKGWVRGARGDGE
jgi:hypothetical protein